MASRDELAQVPLDLPVKRTSGGHKSFSHRRGSKAGSLLELATQAGLGPRRPLFALLHREIHWIFPDLTISPSLLVHSD